MVNHTTATKKNSIYPLLARVSLEVLLLFLISVPVMAGALALEQNMAVPVLSLVLRAACFALALVFGWSIRRKSRELPIHEEVRRKVLWWGCLAGMALLLALHLCGAAPKFFLTISETLGVFHWGRQGGAPYFLALLWERMVGEDFLWGLLFAYGGLLLPVRKRREVYLSPEN